MIGAIGHLMGIPVVQVRTPGDLMGKAIELGLVCSPCVFADSCKVSTNYERAAGLTPCHHVQTDADGTEYWLHYELIQGEQNAQAQQ